MKLSIVPEIINIKGIRFFDERDIEVQLCEKIESNFLTQFQYPYLVIDTFAKKTIKKIEIVPIIDVGELRKLGFVISVISVKSREMRFRNQKRIYLLERITEKIPDSRRINYIPVNHKIQKDVSNKRVRIAGPNAGYPYYTCDYGGCGPWREIYEH